MKEGAGRVSIRLPERSASLLGRLPLKREEGPGPRTVGPLGTREGKEIRPCQHLILAESNPFWTSDFQNCEVVFLKLPPL